METSRVLDKAPARSRERIGPRAVNLDVAALYDAYAAPLYRYLLTLLAGEQDAEDALQEVFLGLLRRGGKAAIRDPQAYLFRAARNQALMARRKRGRRDKEQSAAALSWIDPGQCDPGSRAVAVDIDRAVQQLPAEQREVLALRLSEGMAFREIGEVLRVSTNTAASRYRLALARLRSCLEGGDDDD